MKDRTRTRLKDIAERTGFSINTVSVALRGGEKVPLATRETIIGVARELNYLPNAFARSLASKSSHTVGVILNNLLNPILTLCAQLIERELEARGYRMMLLATDGDLEREKRAIASMREHQVEGILMYPTNQVMIDHIVSLRRSGFPIILLSGLFNQTVDVLSVDDEAGMFKMTSHLLELGHRRIAFVDVGQSAGNFRKLAGYRRAHDAFDAPYHKELIFVPAGRNSANCGYRAGGRVAEIAPRVTAVLASSDPVAIGMMGWCRDNGISVPRDLSIGGFDDIETAAHLNVPLTTVGYSAEGVSKRSVERVLELMGSDAPLPPPVASLIDVDLIVRSSTAPIGGG